MSQDEILFLIVSYLLGSIPFGFILYYLTEKKDIREKGKGKTAALLTFVLGILKGIIPIIYGTRHFDSPVIIILGGAAVILGHQFPIYIKFKGGKGIAPMVGVFLVFYFPSIVVFTSVFIATFFLTRYIVLSSIAGITALFFCILFTHIVEVSTIVLVIAVLIIVKHRADVRRIIAGTENKLYWEKNG